MNNTNRHVDNNGYKSMNSEVHNSNQDNVGGNKLPVFSSYNARTTKTDSLKIDRSKLAKIDDSEFIVDPTASQNKETVLEKNIEWVLTKHKDCMSGKCLEEKLPLLKQSLYKKDYVTHPYQKVIKETSLNPWNGFKPNVSLPIDSTHRVHVYLM